ncbi:unnamed protein product [Prorocentrum cordatum]|uniref:Aspartyl/asparaginy/proline hydroxylase domain-containing protein n=1 Tax=Prorocentrum cordatum TaxID=2364126 RepID=A0ABN9WYR1_9DINO|nr:unnamed protein product [Polarella glacialis]
MVVRAMARAGGGHIARGWRGKNPVAGEPREAAPPSPGGLSARHGPRGAPPRGHRSGRGPRGRRAGEAAREAARERAALAVPRWRRGRRGRSGRAVAVRGGAAAGRHLGRRGQRGGPAAARGGRRRHPQGLRLPEGPGSAGARGAAGAQETRGGAPVLRLRAALAGARGGGLGPAGGRVPLPLGGEEGPALPAGAAPGRLGKQEELSAVWPAIMSTPGIQWRSPLQCPDLVDEGLLEGAEPFPRPEGQRVPELLERHKAAIVREFEQFWKEPSSMDYFSPNQDNDLVAGDRPRQWTEMLIFDKGQWDAKACGHLPTVCGILRGLIDVEGIVHGKRSGQVSLLKLEAGATLVPHFGSVNWRYVAHLGLLVPEGVEMRAGNESRRFVEGELLLLDDSFLHSVQHGGVGPRVTLFVNFFHPKARPVTHAEWLR